MPNLTFLGIENPLGVLGLKVEGELTSGAGNLKPLKHVSVATTDPKKYATNHETNKYTNRAKNLPEGIPELMVKDTIANRDYVQKLLKARQHATVRVAMCSSLNSMLKYLLAYHVAHGPDRFDTVIVYGHGLPGSINIGLGNIAVGAPRPLEHKDYEERKNLRETFGLDDASQGAAPVPRRIRNLTTKNVDVWTGAFAAVQGCLEVGQSGYFHLFLMGCSVGGPKGGDGGMTLQKEAANALAAAVNNDVCVSAPTKTIDDNHLDDLLLRLTQGRDPLHKACAKKKELVALKGQAKEVIQVVSVCSSN